MTAQADLRQTCSELKLLVFSRTGSNEMNQFALPMECKNINKRTYTRRINNVYSQRTMVYCKIVMQGRIFQYLIVNLVFSHFGFWMIALFPEHCLLVPFSVDKIRKAPQIGGIQFLIHVILLSTLYTKMRFV